MVRLSEKQTVAEALKKARIQSSTNIASLCHFSPLVCSGLASLKPETLQWASELDRESSRESGFPQGVGKKAVNVSDREFVNT